MTLYGHSLPGHAETDWQTLEEHLNGVAKLAAAFASFGPEQTAALLGSIHDIGKRSDAFQDRLRGRRGKVDHTTAACLYLAEQWQRSKLPALGKALAELLSYPLLGHHGGMPDYGSQAEEGSLQYRLTGTRVKFIPDWKKEGLPCLPDATLFFEELKPLMQLHGKVTPFAAAFLLRMLYSCLVDADFLDTEHFCSPHKYNLRPKCPDIESLEQKLLRYLAAHQFLPDIPVHEQELAQGSNAPCGSDERRIAIQRARAFMLQRCLDAAAMRPGLFSLTMPTGGGKTLSSLAFALRHARIHGLKKIIIVVPYTSIIEQNADILRKILGDDAILEHHSNYIQYTESETEGDTAELAYKLSTENWNATVIVTTSVQFFESIFSNRPSACRKLHTMAKSVIILDEVQMLPVIYLKPCIMALNILASTYGSSIVLCTATQPALMKSSFLEEGFSPEDVYEIISPNVIPQLFHIFERARVENVGVLDDVHIAARIMQEQQILCIVNSRYYARELFELLENDEANFHLSARMTPAHRTRILSCIRKRLAEGLPCRVISTSLIECGVDISFPVVMREKNGLDSLAQAAGRCNREGLARMGQVLCFTTGRPLPTRASELNRRRRAFDSVASMPDLLGAEAANAYFKALYSASRQLLDEKKILDQTKIWQNTKGIDFMFQFASIARHFHFIEDATESIIVEQEEAGALLRQAGPHGELSSSVLRRLQRFSVQVYRHELERMKRDGRIETRYGFLHVLSGGAGYSEKTGLDVTLENGLPVEDLMF